MELATEIPSHFLCPISLQLMLDPVTIPTGITYDREHIHSWILKSRPPTCPVTRQPLLINGSHDIITPNHTLRRLILSWCTLHHYQRPATLDSSQILKILDDVTGAPEVRYACLQKIKSMLATEYGAKKLLECSGAFEKVASSIVVTEESLSVLAQLDPCFESEVNALLRDESRPFVNPVVGFLRSGSVLVRENAIRVLNSVYEVADPDQSANATCELFVEIGKVIRDGKSTTRATKQALKLLTGLNPWGRNRVKAVRAGLVSVLVDFLVDGSDRRACEMGLTGLDQLCGCAEGRADLVGHGAGLAVVSKKMLRLSHVATDRAVRIMWSIGRCSWTGKVVGEMLEVGVVAKLCMVIQVEYRAKTKERAKEILRLHSRVWKNSPCIPSHLLSSYPS